MFIFFAANYYLCYTKLYKLWVLFVDLLSTFAPKSEKRRENITPATEIAWNFHSPGLSNDVRVCIIKTVCIAQGLQTVLHLREWKLLRHFLYREQKFQGMKVPWNESTSAVWIFEILNQIK